MRQMQAQTMRRLAMLAEEATGRPLRLGRRVTVNQWEQGLLFHHGRLVTSLQPGGHRRWRTGFSLRSIDLRPWIVVLPTQEIPTADGATVKLTISGQARVADAATFVTAARDPEQALYLAVQIALRDVVATMTLEDLLSGRSDLGNRLQGAVRGMEALGVTVERLELKDVILPAELKRAQTEVLVARAQGAAALERARGETAALRNLANAARMVADNPALVQLRLIQQLEGSKGHTVVIGSPPLGAPIPAAGQVHPTTEP